MSKRKRRMRGSISLKSRQGENVKRVGDTQTGGHGRNAGDSGLSWLSWLSWLFHWIVSLIVQRLASVDGPGARGRG